MVSLPHGGRLDEARRRFPAAPGPWLDLSTGINPIPYPFTPPPPETWQRLPDTESLRTLEATAARAYGVTDPAMVVAAPGTQALIQIIPRLFPQPAIRIVGPTYAEHDAAWAAAGSEIHPATAPHGRACVLCNPNNPTGTRHDPADLAVLADSMDLLVVDEAFADFTPGLSLAPHLPLPHTIILRSFGKPYGLAGLRLGFALAEPALATALRTALGPWPVSGPAIAIGTQALNDLPWRDQAAAGATEMAARLDATLQSAGFTILGGTPLFRLAAHQHAPALADRLGTAGIWVRTFEDAPDRLRFGLPPDTAALNRLEAALRT